MGGGLFVVLFYLCIVYFSLLRAFQKTSGSNQVAQRFVHVPKYGAIAVAAIFAYAAVSTVIRNFIS